MKNRTLNCNATNCAHNFNRECRSGVINVSGRSTETTSETAYTIFIDE